MAAFAFTAEYVIVTAERTEEENEPEVRTVVGFADRSRLTKSIGRVIGETLKENEAIPDRIEGEGFGEYDIAYIGGCVGHYPADADWEDYKLTTSPLLAVDEPTLRAAFDAAHGDVNSLAAYARSLLPNSYENEPDTMPTDQPQPVPVVASTVQASPRPALSPTPPPLTPPALTPPPVSPPGLGSPGRMG